MNKKHKLITIITIVIILLSTLIIASHSLLIPEKQEAPGSNQTKIETISPKKKQSM